MGESEAIQQGLLIIGFEQKAQRTFRERAGAMFFMPVCGDKNDRNPMAFALQRGLQLEAVQAGHMQIRYQAGCMMYGPGIQEQFRGRERARLISEGKKEAFEAAPSPTVVVDNADHRDLERLQFERSREVTMSHHLPAVAMPMILPT
jgi:hypothetical protein